MTRKRIACKALIGLSIALALCPSAAFASTADAAEVAAEGTARPTAGLTAGVADLIAGTTTEASSETSAEAPAATTALKTVREALETAAETVVDATAEVMSATDSANKLLAYDSASIAAIGSQEQSGHSVCCPSYACAYADAVLDGTVHDHDYYTCWECTWTDWGGGSSSFRSVGSDEQLLREAYDQITAGKPTVIHVTWSGGEHWIALIGYENATDPDHLTLSNFIALDPWDGAQINAGAKYALYGDGCEHVSDR